MSKWCTRWLHARHGSLGGQVRSCRAKDTRQEGAAFLLERSVALHEPLDERRQLDGAGVGDGVGDVGQSDEAGHRLASETRTHCHM